MPIEVTLTGKWTYPTTNGARIIASQDDAQADGLELEVPAVLGGGAAAVDPLAEPDADSVEFDAPSKDDGDGVLCNPDMLDDYRARIRLGDAHATGATGKGVRIAVLDTGVIHPVAEAVLGDRLRFREGYDELDNDNKPHAVRGLLQNPGPDSNYKHGTWSASLIAAGAHVAEQGLPVGVAPGATILPFRVGQSPVSLLSPRLARGVFKAITAKADIISMAMGGLPSQRWADAANAAYDAGVIFVCAAGNHVDLGPITSPTWVVHPARWERTIAVAGVTLAGKRYALHHLNGTYGNDGPQVDIAATTPCIPMITTDLWGKVELRKGGGTTAATAQVSGALALWLERHGAALTQLVGAQRWKRVEYARAALKESAQPQPQIGEGYIGAGLLDVAKLLDTPPNSLEIPEKPAPRATVTALRDAVEQRLGGGPRTPARVAEAYRSAWFDYVNGTPLNG